MKNMQRYAKSTTLLSGMIIETEKKKKNNNKIRYSSETLSLRHVSKFSIPRSVVEFCATDRISYTMEISAFKYVVYC